MVRAYPHHKRAYIMFSYTYILQSTLDGELYIGSTTDLKRRVGEHNAGKVQSTKTRLPFKLIYYEAYPNEEMARVREASLKKRGSARYSVLKRLGLK